MTQTSACTARHEHCRLARLRPRVASTVATQAYSACTEYVYIQGVNLACASAPIACGGALCLVADARALQVLCLLRTPKLGYWESQLTASLLSMVLSCQPCAVKSGAGSPHGFTTLIWLMHERRGVGMKADNCMWPHEHPMLPACLAGAVGDCSACCMMCSGRGLLAGLATTSSTSASTSP